MWFGIIVLCLMPILLGFVLWNHKKAIPDLDGQILRSVTGEFLLDDHANGGVTIVLRSSLITLIVTACSLLFYNLGDPQRNLEFSYAELYQKIIVGFGWAAGLFAGCYLALYTRFSTQWQYLANLYNQIMSERIKKSTDGSTNNEQNDSQLDSTSQSDKKKDHEDHEDHEDHKAIDLSTWKTAFLEDAMKLHLARKDVFQGVIYAWGKDSSVTHWYKQENGETGLEELDSIVKEIEKKRANRAQNEEKSPSTPQGQSGTVQTELNQNSSTKVENMVSGAP